MGYVRGSFLEPPMIDRQDKEIARCLTSLKEHTLECVENGEKIKAFYIKKPGTRMMSTLILFTPEGIALMGDLTPTRNGTVSAFGYGLGWFAGQLSPSYISEKFLETQWVPELAAESLQWELDQGPENFGKKCIKKVATKEKVKSATPVSNDSLESDDSMEVWEEELEPEWDEDCKANLEKIIEACKDRFFTSFELYTALEDLEWYYMDEGIPGHGYQPNEVAWLCAIQQTFARLYHDSVKETTIV